MMRGRSVVLPGLGLIAALLACKGNKSDDEPTEASEAESEREQPAEEQADAPERATPAELSAFEGCDLKAAKEAFRGSWYATLGRPVAWKLEGDELTWYDGVAAKRGELTITSPCSAENGQGITFTYALDPARDQLIVGSPAVGRRCGERLVGCTADSVYVLEGDECTRLTSTPVPGKDDVREWKREPAECKVERNQLVVTDRQNNTYRAPRVQSGFLVYTWSADEVDSFATAKQMVDIRRQGASAGDSGAAAITAKWEKLCDETKAALACNAAAWERCVDLNQCHLAVQRAKTAAEGRPHDGVGALDTYAVVLCKTGKTEEANSYFERSCKAGYTKNCGKKCTPEVAAQTTDSTTLKKDESATPAATATAPADEPKRPARPKRPNRPAR